MIFHHVCAKSRLFLSSAASVWETDECTLTFGWLSLFFNASPTVCVRNTAVSVFLPVRSPTTIISMVQNVNPLLICSFTTHATISSAVIQSSSGPPDHIDHYRESHGRAPDTPLSGKMFFYRLMQLTTGNLTSDLIIWVLLQETHSNAVIRLRCDLILH